MSRYTVEVTRNALDEAEAQWEYVTVDGVTDDAIKWWNGLADAIESLADNPERCGLAPETDEFNLEVRQLLYGKRKRDKRRVLFTIKGKKVLVLLWPCGSRGSVFGWRMSRAGWSAGSWWPIRTGFARGFRTRSTSSAWPIGLRPLAAAKLRATLRR